MGEQYYLDAFAEFKDMGLLSAALKVLEEGVAAHPTSAKLQELAEAEGLEAPAPAPAQSAPHPAEVLDLAPASPSATPAQAARPSAPPAPWRPPTSATKALQEDKGSAAVKAFREAQAAHAAFAEADKAAWTAVCKRLGNPSGEALLAEERRLRADSARAFTACKADLRRHNLDFLKEHLRSPNSPAVASRVHEAHRRSGAQGALREEVAAEEPGAFSEGGQWDEEGPGAYLETLKRLSEADAYPSRARELGQAGPGTVHEALSALARETEAAVAGLPAGSAKVLVLGGHGASAVVAARAGARRVVVFEPRRFVTCALREVFRRNLTTEQIAVCEVVDRLGPPPDDGAWDVIVVDLWHTAGAFPLGPLAALRSAARAAAAVAGGSGGSTRVIPCRVVVEVALADGRLASVSGFDLSRMDDRFRGTAVVPLAAALGEEGHPTSLRPRPLTTTATAFDIDLSHPDSVALELGPVPLQLKGTRTGRATAAVVSVHLRLAEGSVAKLAFAQWMLGGLAVQEGRPVPGVTARCNPGHVWVDWDFARAEEPPVSFMALSDWYFEMLRDGARHDLYERAIKAEVAAVRARTGGGCRVLDIGSGDGILSMMALRAGATAVVGVEYVASLARTSEAIVAANRSSATGSSTPAPLADEKSAPLEIWCTDARGISLPPEDVRFDLLVSELMDASGLGENLIALTRGARQRLCNDGAPVIPARLRLFAVLCEVRLPELAGVNMDAFWPVWPPERNTQTLWLGVDLDKGEGSFRVLTEPTELLSLELGWADVTAVPGRKALVFRGSAAGTANFVVWWFETQLSTADPSAVLTNAPKCVDARHEPTCWGQAMAELPSWASVEVGSAVDIAMEVPFGDYQLRFRPAGAAVAGAAEAAAAASPKPPPGAEPYSAEFLADLAEFKKCEKEAQAFVASKLVGRSAIRQADVGAIGALQRCALGIASQPYLFGVEPATAHRSLHLWYAVGGEGRS